MALTSAAFRSVLGALIGNIRLHKNTQKINIIVVSISTLFFFNSKKMEVLEPNSIIKGIILTLLSGICVFLIFQYSDKRETKKNIKKKENKYMWEDFLDSQ